MRQSATIKEKTRAAAEQHAARTPLLQTAAASRQLLVFRKKERKKLQEGMRLSDL